MPSRSHQRILALILKRMEQRGFSAVAVDGTTENMSGSSAVRPSSYGRHRPDALGVSEDGDVCVGEAKTADDVCSQRTLEQLSDYLSASDTDYPAVIFGYPRSADASVRRMLVTIGASDCPQLELLPVPDELLDHAQ